MNSQTERILTQLHSAFEAMDYWPHVPLRLRTICVEVQELIAADVRNLCLSEEDAAAAELDHALVAVFAAFFLPPASATAIAEVLTEIEHCLRDFIVLNPTLASAGQHILGSFGRFRHHILSLSAHEAPHLQHLGESCLYGDYPLYRLHLDFRGQAAYRPLALPLTLRLQWLFLVMEDEYRYIEKTRRRNVAGLLKAALARRGRMARQLVLGCAETLLTTTSPITIPVAAHFTTNTIPPALEEPIHFLFHAPYYAKGHRPQAANSPRVSAAATNTASTTYGPLPSTIVAQSVTSHTVPPPSGIDATAIPKGDLEEPIVQHRPAHPDLPHERSLQPFLNYRIQIQHAQMAVPSVHDIRIIQMSEYQAILSRLPLATPLNTVNDKDLFMSTITLAVMFYGQKPTVMLQTVITELAPEPSGFEETKDTIHLEYARSSHTLSYLFPHDWLGYTGPDEHPFLQSCIATTRHVCLPLFAPFADLFQECYWRNVGRIYRESEQHGRALLFNHLGLPSDPNERENHINAWLGTFEPPHRPGRWTLANLAESWFVHATQRFNMDPVIALWVSGQRQWAVRAPSQYTAFPAARLVRDLKALHMKWWKLLDAPR